ncbi:Tc toxin subunit A [Pseudomonas japonica]|uniref:Tc toxin subunit A n=1 Tax=Pseudomonas japonica TaxID=256466 RepID=UPI003818147A
MARRTTAPASDSLTRIATRPGQAGQLLQAGLGSAFEIARGSVESLMKRVPELDGDEAHRVHQRATALAVLAARQYREQRLTAQVEIPSPPWRTGLRALVDGPTFESQFNPSWGDNCPPEAIEATTSPAAYLTALFQWVTQVIEPQANQEEGKPIFLAARRPDLAALMLDNHSLERVEPTIGIVNEILESAARKHLDDHNQKTLAVDDALLLARYPFGLPFERYMSQINAILQRKGYSLGELIRQLDPDFPYFCRGGLHSPRSDEALQLDMAIGPEQRALLLEAAYFPRGMRRVSTRSVQTRVNPRTLLRESLHTLQSGFYQRHYGVAKADDLLPLSAFCLRTGLDQDGVESLLSIERHAPVASPNVPGLAAPTPARFGSVYINAGTEPTIGIVSVDGEHALSDWVADHFDRMQRMIRLARWIDLPFAEVDQIIDAALRAEHGEAGRGREISENTLRALGLFRRLRGDFKVSAEDFAALLDGVALYARGSAVPQFDRVFNDPALFSEPLVLDDSAFSIVPGNAIEYHKVHHLCSALGISFETYLYLARYIAQAHGPQQLEQASEERLSWSHAVVSAFYRLARLPAWLGLGCVEILALLQLMGERGHQYVSRLVNAVLATHQHSELVDTLGVVQSLADTVRWLRDNDLEVAWLYQHLMPLAPVAVASDRELDLLRQIAARMAPTLLSEASFRDAGLPMIYGIDKPTPIDWMKQLELFVSEQGLILDRPEDPDNEAYEAALRKSLEIIIDNLELPDGPHVLVRVFQLVMDARSAQRSLVWESLADLFGGSAELSQELLGWAGGSSYQLLDEVLEVLDGPLPVPVGDDVLTLLARLTQRMGIVERLGLSPLALRCWWQHRDWFEGEQDDEDTSTDITFSQLHVLVQYRHLLEFTRQAEQALLDYLRLVNSLPTDLSEEDLRLIREEAAGKIAQFTGFSIRDILETAQEITADGLICTVRQMDHLVRVRLACETLQLGTSAALELGALRGNSVREDYRAAAEGALSSLVAALDQQAVPTQGELGQSETSWIVVGTPRLVARTEERARCLLTVRNFLGEPQANISVTWETNLSRLDAPSSASTDVNGQVWVDLQAGDEMGTAQVIARFGLERQILAPLILIDCDLSSLSFKNPVRAPDEALAGNLQMIEFHIETEDDFGNPGRDQVVQWSTDLGNFERPQTRTDAAGVASARLRSLSSGEATVMVELPINGKQASFASVTFLEQLYFQYVRFSGPVAAGQHATATCRVVNLDGSPQKRVTVLWSANYGSLESDRSISDDDGIAVITYLAPEPGEVILTINAIYDHKPLQPLSSEPTRVHELPKLVDMDPMVQYYALQQARPASFQVRLEPPAAGYPVTWWAGETLLATTYTSVDGSAGYLQHFNEEQVGEREITVRSLRENDMFVFKVHVVFPHERLVPRAGPDSPGIDLAEADKWVFAVDPGLNSTLLVFAERFDGEGDTGARLTVTLDDQYADPTALGVVFDPPLGEPIDCDAEGKIALRINCTNAAFLANSDPHNNHIRLHVESNLGRKVSLWVGLRYLLDLAKSDLRFFRDTVDDVDHAVLSGRLVRRNGEAPMYLREEPGQRRLQLMLEGANSPVADLLSYSEGKFWVHAGSFQGESGSIGSKCRFSPIGDLNKRVHFAGSDTYEAQRIIPGLTLTLTLSPDTGLLWDEGNLVADQGDNGRLILTISDAEGPIVGMPLLDERTQVGSVVYRGGGLTDAKGQTWLDIDARNGTLEGRFPFLIALGAQSTTLDLLVRQLIVTDARMHLWGEDKVFVTMHFSRRKDLKFTVDGKQWGFEYDVDGSMSYPRVTFDADGAIRESYVMLGSKLLTIDEADETNVRFRLYGPTEFPIAPDLKADKS